MPESELHFAAHWGWWRIAHNMRTALQRADGLLGLAHRTGDDELVLQAHHREWVTNFHLGNHASCLEHIEKGLSLYDPDRFTHRSMAATIPKCVDWASVACHSG